jgi:hypothetical protein
MKNRLTRRLMKAFAWLALVGALSFGAPIQTDAQCPMCRMSVESNYANGGSAGKGLNMGILYILAMPYLLVGTIGFLWWRNRNKQYKDN